MKVEMDRALIDAVGANLIGHATMCYNQIRHSNDSITADKWHDRWKRAVDVAVKFAEAVVQAEKTKEGASQ